MRTSGLRKAEYGSECLYLYQGGGEGFDPETPSDEHEAGRGRTRQGKLSEGGRVRVMVVQGPKWIRNFVEKRAKREAPCYRGADQILARLSRLSGLTQ